MIRAYNTRSRSKLMAEQNQQEAVAQAPGQIPVVVRNNGKPRSQGLRSKKGPTKEDPKVDDAIGDKSIAPRVLLTPEILNMILSNVRDVKNLKSCNRVSKLWHPFTTQFLDKRAQIFLKNRRMVQEVLGSKDQRKQIGLTPRACQNLKICFTPKLLVKKSKGSRRKKPVLKPSLRPSMEVISYLQGSMTSLHLENDFYTFSTRVEDIPKFVFPQLQTLIYSPGPKVTDPHAPVKFTIEGPSNTLYDALLSSILNGAKGSLRVYCGLGLKSYRAPTVMRELTALTHLDLEGVISFEDLQGMRALEELGTCGIIGTNLTVDGDKPPILSLKRLKVDLPTRSFSPHPQSYFGMRAPLIQPLSILYPNLVQLEHPHMDDSTLQAVFEHLPGLLFLVIGQGISTFGMTGIRSENYQEVLGEIDRDPGALERHRGTNRCIGSLTRLQILFIYPNTFFVSTFPNNQAYDHRENQACVLLGLTDCRNLKVLVLLDECVKTWCVNERSIEAIADGLSLEFFDLTTSQPGIQRSSIDYFTQKHPECKFKLTYREESD